MVTTLVAQFWWKHIHHTNTSTFSFQVILILDPTISILYPISDLLKVNLKLCDQELDLLLTSLFRPLPINLISFPRSFPGLPPTNPMMQVDKRLMYDVGMFKGTKYSSCLDYCIRPSAWPHELLDVVLISAVQCSIGSTIGFHNHGEGPYQGLILV